MKKYDNNSQKKIYDKRPRYFIYKIGHLIFEFLILIFLLIGIPFYYYESDNTTKQDYVQSLEGNKFQQLIDLGPSGTIRIIDSLNQTTSHILKEICSQHSQFKWDCQKTLEVSSTKFNKLEITCPKGECKVFIESLNFNAHELFIYGKKISMKAQQLNTTNFFFDTIKGNVLVEQFLGVSASVSTTQGDIIIQTEVETKISTFSKSKSVCLTGEQGWNNQVQKVKHLEEAFNEKDPKLQPCLEISSFEDRDYDRMVKQSKHVVFDSLILNNTSLVIDSLCVEITDFMIFKNDYDTPSNITSFVEIRAANLEGNININVKNYLNNFTYPIPNSVYETSKLKISNIWMDRLNQTFKEITEQGRYNEIVFLNFGFESQPEMVWIILFTPFYLHFSPKWVSIFSLSGLSSKQQIFNVEMSQGFCPLYYKYESSEDIIKYVGQTHQNRTSKQQTQLEEILEDYFKFINIEPFLIIPLSIYDQFSVFDPETFPQNYEKIEQQIFISKISKIIFVAIVSVQSVALFIVTALKLMKLIEPISFDSDQKTFFNLLQLIKQENKNKYRFPPKSKSKETSLISKRTNSLNEVKMDKIQISYKQCRENEEESQLIISNQEIIPECIGDNGHFQFIIQQRDINIYSLSDLVSKGTSWVQRRSINSLEFFYQVLFYPLKDLLKDNTTCIYNPGEVNERLIEERVVMKISELKQVYQLFCFCFQLTQQNILSETNKKLVGEFGFEICYEKRIMLEEPQDNLEEWSDCKQYYQQQVIELFQYIKGFFPNKNNISLPHFLLKLANTQYYKELKVETEKKYPELKQLSPGFIKVSKNLVVSQLPDSPFVINNQLISFLRQKCGDDYIGIKYGEGQLIKTKWYKQLMKNINIIYQQLLLIGSFNMSILDNQLQSLRYIIQTLLLGLTPMFMLLFALIQLQIKYTEENKTNERRKIIILEKQQFQIPVFDIFIYFCIIVQGTFAMEFYSGYYFKITSMNKIGQIVRLQNLKTNEEMIIKKLKFKCKIALAFFIEFSFSIFFSLLFVGFINSSMVFIFAGSILIPNVMLPMAIVVFALVSIIYIQVNSYTQLEERGKEELKRRFKNNLLSKFKENNKQELSIDEELIYPHQIKERKLNEKDPEHHYLGDFQDMFNSMDTNNDDLVDIQEIFNKFKEVDMSISPQILDQMVAKVKSVYNLDILVFKFGNPKNFKLNKKEFCSSIEYLFEEKVKTAMQILGISVYDLILMILSIIFQSIIASAFIYAIFRGLSTNNTPLILGTQNIASFIGFLGIFYSRRIDQSKKIQDIKIMNIVIQEVEDMFHLNNPLTYENFKNEEVLQLQTPSSPINDKRVEGIMLQTEQVQLLVSSGPDQNGEIELQNLPSQTEQGQLLVSSGSDQKGEIELQKLPS